MKLLKLTLIIFSLSVITTLHSCKPEPPDPGPKDLGLLGLGEAKDYLYFKSGTLWVFQNTRTGEYDSIEVYSSVLDTLEQVNKKWRFTNEVFSVKSKSITTGYYYNLSQVELPVETINEPKAVFSPFFERYNPYIGQMEPFYYPFSILEKKPNSTYERFCINVRDTIMLNNNIYKNVAIFYLKNDFLEPLPRNGWPAKYYWAKNQGLIRKDLFEPKFFGDTSRLYHSWKLIHSKIIQ